MASARLQQVLEEIQQLPLAEQIELRTALERTMTDAVNRQMLADGVLTEIPPPLSAEEAERQRNWKPIAISGKPLSETILEERR